jgi:hypothetical protein
MQRWRRHYVTGWLMVGSGVGIVLISSMIEGGFGNPFDSAVQTSVFSAGVAIDLIGIILLIANDGKINKSVVLYNSSL